MGKALFGWQCCSGTYPQDIAEYNNMLYYTDSDSVYVSQYLPSRFLYKKDNIAVEIENISNYPQEEQLKFSIKTDKEVKFNFKFRVPNWSMS
jgi:DUF1680 family protein